MSRLWLSGLELNSTSLELSNTSISGGGSVSIVTNIVRSGTYAAKSANAGSAGISRFDYQFKSSASAGPFFVRIYVYIADRPSAIQDILCIASGTSSGTRRARVRLNTTGTLELWNSSAKIGSASAALSLNTWYMIELSYQNGANASLEAKLDGSSFASTAASADVGNVDRISFGGVEAGQSHEYYFDDIGINDSNGSSQNSFPGSGKIISLKPNAQGDSNGYLVTNGGTAGAGNNYTRVQEVTPDDATTYNASVLLAAEDLFNCDDSGIGAGDVINLVSVGARFANLVGADATTSFQLEIEKASGGTKSQSSAIIPNSTTWKTNAPASPANYPITMYQDPDGSNWSKATLDSMQIGYIVSAAGVNTAAISNIWAMVDYTPGVAPANNSGFLGLM